MNRQESQTVERFLAIDLHKHYLVVGGVDAREGIVLSPRRVDLENWSEWSHANLKPSDSVVLEATTNAWEIYDQVVPLVRHVVVANPVQVKWIASTRVKTDRVDVLKLAKLLAAGLVPEVWVPPIEVRELRSLISHRRRLVKMQTMIRNRLHSVVHRHNLNPPEGNLFVAAQREWWQAQKLSPTERLCVRQDLVMLDHLGPQIKEAEAELERLSACSPWAEQVPYLLQIPGFGLINTMTLLGAIGDITRFEGSKKLVGYAGLGASVHESGETHHTGRITKQGRRELRWALVEAARVAVLNHPYWEQEYQRFARRMEGNKAIVAIAHKLLVVVWHLLTERTGDRKADPEMVAFKFMKWSWELNDEARGGLSTRQFVRYQLMQLKLGEELTCVQRGGSRRPLATRQEIWALRPELRQKL
jgi:transposase